MKEKSRRWNMRTKRRTSFIEDDDEGELDNLRSQNSREEEKKFNSYDDFDELGAGKSFTVRILYFYK